MWGGNRGLSLLSIIYHIYLSSRSLKFVSSSSFNLISVTGFMFSAVILDLDVALGLTAVTFTSHITASFYFLGLFCLSCSCLHFFLG